MFERGERIVSWRELAEQCDRTGKGDLAAAARLAEANAEQALRDQATALQAKRQMIAPGVHLADLLTVFEELDRLRSYGSIQSTSTSVGVST